MTTGNGISNISKMLRDERSAKIFYRESSDSIYYEFPVDRMQEWYDESSIPVSARFSLDLGTTWESIYDLRRRNGPCFPFIAKNEKREETPGFGSIEVARRMITAYRGDIDRMEKDKNELEREVEEQERMVEKMKEMEKELLTLKLKPRPHEKHMKVEDRKISVVACVQKENRTAVKESMKSDNNNNNKSIRPKSIARPPILPLLQASSVPSDTPVSRLQFDELRKILNKGISATAKAATVNFFPAHCAICGNDWLPLVPLSDLTSFLEHVTSKAHLDNITSKGGKVTAAQCLYWSEILDRGYATRAPV